ncbi:hypothetical protein AB2M62_17845 [Sphingomonas sp. MMS12-HWE2-04]|uniref:hypothetical protein n=1 Tax=Sphingomonas sp. MMS12-HWE2-04 TaxID=3234199 RepID=UPI00384E85F6
MMRLSLLPLLLLSACGGGGVSTETTDDPTGQNVAAAAASGKPAAVTAAADCSNRPDFVPIYAGGQVTQCIAGPDGKARHVSGSIVYLTDTAPREVLGWSRAQANAEGLAPREATDNKYAAGEEGKRTLLFVVDSFGGRTRVTINWSSGV